MVELNLSIVITAPIDRCFDLSRSVEVHLSGTEQTGEQAVGGVTTGLIGMGEFVRWRAKHFGIRQQLASRITAYERPTYFQDTMVEGAFRFMQHDHYFESVNPNRTIIRDRFVFAAPLPPFGLLAEQFVLKSYMRKFLDRRNNVMREIAESDDWQRFLPADSRANA